MRLRSTQPNTRLNDFGDSAGHFLADPSELQAKKTTRRWFCQNHQEREKLCFLDQIHKRVMEAYKLAEADSRKRRLEAERTDVDIDRRFLAEVALHKAGYPAFVDHGNPQIHIGDGLDILSRRMIADCEIGESKTFFRLLKVQ
jgi:hypothetical protein